MSFFNNFPSDLIWLIAIVLMQWDRHKTAQEHEVRVRSLVEREKYLVGRHNELVERLNRYAKQINSYREDRQFAREDGPTQ